MLPKKNRFSFKGSLPKKVLNSQGFSLRYGKNDNGLKAAVVVSRRVDKRATVRNRIKRKILEIARLKLSMDTPLNLVFYVKAQALNLENLENEVNSILAKIK